MILKKMMMINIKKNDNNNNKQDDLHSDNSHQLKLHAKDSK